MQRDPTPTPRGGSPTARIALTFDNLGEAAEEELGEPVARGAHH
jgi:hypothetical protein